MHPWHLVEFLEVLNKYLLNEKTIVSYGNQYGFPFTQLAQLSTPFDFERGKNVKRKRSFIGKKEKQAKWGAKV